MLLIAELVYEREEGALKSNEQTKVKPKCDNHSQAVHGKISDQR